MIEKIAISNFDRPAQIRISMGIIAWNEEEAIGVMLESLFKQSLFNRLNQRNLKCEIMCLANGCTDATTSVARRIFEIQSKAHPFKETFSCRVIEMDERGKMNAWNTFVHQLASPESRFCFLMDGDILIHHQDTLWNMYIALINDPDAFVSVDQPLKDISFKAKKSISDRISLITSKITQSGEAQMSGQLYCIRREIAQRIHLPKDLIVEDGFIKAIVCTDFLTREVSPNRILHTKDASHLFEAYTAIRDILKNQKRQMIGQTMVHILVDKYLKKLPLRQRSNLHQILNEKEKADAFWLKELINDHLDETRYFWRLFPGVLTFRFKRLSRMEGMAKVVYFPIALIGFWVTMVACYMAHRYLKTGFIDYWPDTKSTHLKALTPVSSNAVAPSGLAKNAM